MTYYMEKVRKDNVIIAYYKGMGIIEDEYGNLYFMKCDEEQAPIGTIAEDDAIVSIKNLPEELSTEIKTVFGKGDD